MPSPRLLVALVVAVVVLLPSTTAEAAPTGDLLYSTDGGATWSTSASLGPNGTVLVRQWFDNDGDDVVEDASVTSTRPADLALVAGSTRVCLDPTTTDPAAPDGAELACSPADEAAAWTGTELALAPSAGHVGVSAGAAVGPLAAGRKRYLNFMQAEVYYPGFSSYPGPPPAGVYQTMSKVSAPAAQGGDRWTIESSVSNTAEPYVNSTYWGKGVAFLDPMLGHAEIELLGRRWLNLDECHWRKADGRVATSYLHPQGNGPWWWWTAPDGWMASGFGFWGGTAASQFADRATPDCGPAEAGWTLDAAASGALSLDVLNDRYLRIQECRFQTVDPANRGYYSSIVHNDPADEAHGTTTSDTPSDLATWGCGNPDPATYEHSPPVAYRDFPSGEVVTVDQEGAVEFDLLDTARARGYVEYELQAGPGPSAEACLGGLPGGTQQLSQPAALLVGGSPVATSTGATSIDWSAVPGGDPCPGNASPVVDPVVAGLSGGLVAGAALVSRRRRRPEREGPRAGG